ncbi:C2H2 type zinc finger domain-containing protein [Thelonectria olida]|uniref:C2H2 type zinc finger domain-containing protein n=1 Tax=Thelonectria olida TaxID=1576542 RepID=A0A9P8VQP9_9HYPO|nr:C2H2 type zinc finger domain-containing protein [Thelonectria olida]
MMVPDVGADPSSTPRADSRESSYACSVCSKTYKRREHLHRHAASHNSLRPHRCPWCNSTYQRADVLKRHSQACQLKAATNGGLVSNSGRRRACDHCVRQKKACSTGQPCDGCRRKSLQCCYSFGVDTSDLIRQEGNGRQAGDSASCTSTETLLASEMQMATLPITPEGVVLPGHLDAYAPAFNFIECSAANNTSWLDFFNFAAENLPSDQPRSELESYKFSFLDNFTQRSGLADSFDCGTPSQREAVILAFEQAESIELGSASTASDPSLAHLLTPQDPLIIKTHQILQRIKEVVTLKPRNSCVTMEWSSILEQRCLEFFSPQNLRKFLALYWEIWHPNVNIIHRPSFSPACSKSILIAGMALIGESWLFFIATGYLLVLGACVSPDPTDNEQARPWFNCVEEVVFTDDDFCNDPLYTCDSSTLDPLTNIRKVQALQAGYIVCLYQNWEGADASKRRIRRYRFSTLVSVARDIGITSAKHRDYGLSSHYDFDWKDFIAREQLVRTFLWIYLLDHAFVIFNNLPPRMVIKEMDMHMAWPEATFQAPSGAQCAEEVHKWLLRSLPMCKITIREAIESFCKDTLGPDIRRCYADVGPLNLFVIVSAFHTLVFQQQNSSFCGIEQLQAVRIALQNWKLIWETYSSEFSSTPPHEMVGNVTPSPGNMWRRTGFMRHSPEYWLLANLMVNRLSRTLEPQPNFNEAVLTGGSTPDPILSKYDQTSMRQVNDLIAEFQNVHIG